MVNGKGFRDLRVWQCGMELVVEVYRLTKGFPKDELYGLTNQLRRAVVSVPSNVAEGQARSHIKEFLQFLSTAQGSLAEVQTQLELAGRLRYLSAEQLEPALEQANSLAKQLHSLRSSLVDRK
jgi:four helix bundle protein